MSDDIIKKALGMGISGDAVDDATALVPIEAEVIQTDELEMDFEYVRENLQELIAQGKDAISELILIAKQSQHPRAFEVIATLMKATADINNDLMTTHKKKADLKGNSPAHTKGTGPITNHNVFVGSTAELQKMISDMKKND